MNIDTPTLLTGDCRELLQQLPDNSVDAIVTDPPYELGFMGKKWDSSGVAYDVNVWRECLRVLKPGGHLLAFSGTRTYHRMVVSIEDSGFEIRDMIAWISNKTFPKSHNVEKATGDDAWSGWGTALKPSLEPIVMARKPLIGTVAENVLEWGTGGLNIDGSRIGSDSVTINTFDNGAKPFGGAVGEPFTSRQSQGRWPANVMLDKYTAALLDEQSGISKDGIAVRRNGNKANGMFPVSVSEGSQDVGFGGSGGASRFFYVAKASKRDRNEGLEDSNSHPTVKPTQLMRYLIKLVTPPGGVVLDPFTGSGSTGKAAILEGFRFIGVELSEEYLPIIEGRLRHAMEQRKKI